MLKTADAGGGKQSDKEGTSVVEKRQELYNFSLESSKMTSLSALKYKQMKREVTADSLQSLAGANPAVSPSSCVCIDLGNN